MYVVFTRVWGFGIYGVEDLGFLGLTIWDLGFRGLKSGGVRIYGLPKSRLWGVAFPGPPQNM